jgi:hypothetical protein
MTPISGFGKGNHFVVVADDDVVFVSAALG